MAALFSGSLLSDKSGPVSRSDYTVRHSIAAKKFAVTTEFINRLEQPLIITMIRERIERLKTWAKESLAAFKAKLAAAIKKLSSLFSADYQIAADLVACEGNFTDAGKCFRLSSGHAHAPLFSLYTFFKR